MPIRLVTPRLVLDPAHVGALDALHALWTHPVVRRWLWDDRTIARDEAAATLADCEALAPRGLGLWTLHARDAVDAIEEPASGPATLLGCAGLLPVGESVAACTPRLAGGVEVLVALAPSAWGHGYAHEALGTLQQYAADALGLAELAGACDVPNVASDRMLRRAGFRALDRCARDAAPLRTYRWTAPRDQR